MNNNEKNNNYSDEINNICKKSKLNIPEYIKLKDFPELFNLYENRVETYKSVDLIDRELHNTMVFVLKNKYQTLEEKQYNANKLESYINNILKDDIIDEYNYWSLTEDKRKLFGDMIYIHKDQNKYTRAYIKIKTKIADIIYFKY